MILSLCLTAKMRLKLGAKETETPLGEWDRVTSRIFSPSSHSPGGGVRPQEIDGIFMRRSSFSSIGRISFFSASALERLHLRRQITVAIAGSCLEIWER